MELGGGLYGVSDFVGSKLLLCIVRISLQKGILIRLVCHGVGTKGKQKKSRLLILAHPFFSLGKYPAATSLTSTCTTHSSCQSGCCRTV